MLTHPTEQRLIALGLAGMAKARKVEVVRGYGSFLDPHHLEVELTDGAGQSKTGAKKVVRFAKAIIAAGSQSIRLPFAPDDPRIVDSTGALELASVPKRMLVVGGGIIGLEMGTVYSTLGARLDVVEMLDGLMQGADRDLVKVWEKVNAARFDHVMLKTKTVGAKATKAGIEVSFEGEKAPGTPMVYGAFTSNVDMRTGSPAFGTPEFVKAAFATGQMARRYGLPWRSSNATARPIQSVWSPSMCSLTTSQATWPMQPSSSGSPSSLRPCDTSAKSASPRMSRIAKRLASSFWSSLRMFTAKWRSWRISPFV